MIFSVLRLKQTIIGAIWQCISNFHLQRKWKKWENEIERGKTFFSSCSFDPAMHISFHLLDLSKYFDCWWHIIVLYHPISTKMSYYDGLMVKYSCLFKDSDIKIWDCNDMIERYCYAITIDHWKNREYSVTLLHSCLARVNFLSFGLAALNGNILSWI